MTIPMLTVLNCHSLTSHADFGIRMQLNGGSLMKIRTDDPLYLNHVDRFWGHLLPRISPLTYQNGGPIVMVQVRPSG